VWARIVSTLNVSSLRRSNLNLRRYNLAPEVLRCNAEMRRQLRAEGKRGYGPEVDCWAIGVLAYEYLVGEAPHTGESLEEMLSQIDQHPIFLDPNILHGMSPEAKDFILCCLDLEPTTRITAQEMLSHPWILKRCPANAGASAPHDLDTLSSALHRTSPRPTSAVNPAAAAAKHDRIFSRVHSHEWGRRTGHDLPLVC